MFREAYKKAYEFTCPAIIYSQTVEGRTYAAVGAFVVVNSDGWIVTAAHIIHQGNSTAKADFDARQFESARNAINANQSFSNKEKQRKIAALGTPHKKSIRRGFTQWRWANARLKDVTILDEADLAVGRLEPFDASLVKNYPEFKDPQKNFTPGSSLCKLGYPFVQLSPSFDEATNLFSLPADQLMLPFFPIEGLFTRTIPGPPPNSIPNYPVTFLETSSPGLKGQSGGPTFDADGAIWAIQSQTRSLPLDFSPEVVVGGQKHKEHQFINIGLGTHVETVLGLFNQLGIKHAVSNS
jgi:hypothetical protein